MAVGWVFIVVAMFFPLMTVRYAPPGGSAELYGHKVSAFVDTITVWQFSTTARWSHVLLLMAGMFGLGVLRIISNSNESEGSTILLRVVHALVHVIVVFGWLVLLGIGVAEDYLTLPTDGEKGILPAFRVISACRACAGRGLRAPRTPGRSPRRAWRCSSPGRCWHAGSRRR
jgi:hypothetical protein